MKNSTRVLLMLMAMALIGRSSTVDGDGKSTAPRSPAATTRAPVESPGKYDWYIVLGAAGVLLTIATVIVTVAVFLSIDKANRRPKELRRQRRKNREEIRIMMRLEGLRLCDTRAKTLKSEKGEWNQQLNKQPSKQLHKTPPPKEQQDQRQPATQQTQQQQTTQKQLSPQDPDPKLQTVGPVAQNGKEPSQLQTKPMPNQPLATNYQINLTKQLPTTTTPPKPVTTRLFERLSTFTFDNFKEHGLDQLGADTSALYRAKLTIASDMLHFTTMKQLAEYIVIGRDHGSDKTVLLKFLMRAANFTTEELEAVGLDKLGELSLDMFRQKAKMSDGSIKHYQCQLMVIKAQLAEEQSKTSDAKRPKLTL